MSAIIEGFTQMVTFSIIERSNAYSGPVTVQGGFEFAESALDYIARFYGIVDCEEDADHPSHYDLLTKTGRVFAVEPVVS